MLVKRSTEKLLCCAFIAIILAGCAASATKENTEYRVVIPEEEFTLIEFRQNDLPGIATANSALVDFSPKVVFGWHLSILIEAENLANNGMPTPEEQELLYAFEDSMTPIIKENGNALLLARVTHDGTRELLYRVYDPEPAHQYLQSVLTSKTYLRPFDYRIDYDPDWDKAEWYLDAVSPLLNNSQ